MNKKYMLSKMYAFGDAVITLHSGEAFLGTTDFSLPFIRKHRRKRFDNLKGKVIVFNYTDNEFVCVNTRDIAYLNPLSKILNNPGRE